MVAQSNNVNRSLVVTASLKPHFDLQVCLSLYDQVKNGHEIATYVTKKPQGTPVHIFVNPHMVIVTLVLRYRRSDMDVLVNYSCAIFMECALISAIVCTSHSYCFKVLSL